MTAGETGDDESEVAGSVGHFELCVSRISFVKWLQEVVMLELVYEPIFRYVSRSVASNTPLVR
jgi:hypothetical protein